MSENDNALSLCLALVDAFETCGISYAVGGALALGMWATPRATLDVDVNVFIKDTEIETLAACLVSLGIEADAAALRAQSESAGLIVVRWHGVRLDLFTPSIDFSSEAERTRVRITIEGKSFWVLSREALAVFKLLFFRPKDLADVAQLVATAPSAIDTQYVRRSLADMMGEDDERVRRWDAIVASGGQRL